MYLNLSLNLEEFLGFHLCIHTNRINAVIKRFPLVEAAVNVCIIAQALSPLRTTTRGTNVYRARR